MVGTNCDRIEEKLKRSRILKWRRLHLKGIFKTLKSLTIQILKEVARADNSGRDCPSPVPVDQPLLSCVTETVQSQERLDLQLRRSFQNSDQTDEDKQKLKSDSRDVLEKLREMKSRLDGSSVGFKHFSLNHHSNTLNDLKQLTLMHVPSSLTDDVRNKFKTLIKDLFHGRCKRLLSATMLSCPWYQASQRERGEQARHNIILVVYVTEDKQFFSPANHQEIDQSDVMDLGWLYAVELYHFAHCLVKGKARFSEAIYCHNQALLWRDESWQRLQDNLNHKVFMGLRGFVEQCRGQAIGGIAKKRKTGKMGLRDGVTIQDFCESFRLLNNLHNLGKGEGPCTDDLDLKNLPSQADLGLQKLKALYKDPDVSKLEIFQIITDWRDELNKSVVNKLKFTPVTEVEGIVGKWLAEVRVQGQHVTLPTDIVGDAHTEVVLHMEKIGGPLTKMKPEQILMITQAGSHMYGLSTPESDADFVVVYRENTETILLACSRLTEIHENRGPGKDFEYGIYEVRTFCTMLLKCSVVILELLFVEEIDYSSPEWKILAKHKDAFMTEKAVQQFLGLIKNNFHFLSSEKHRGTSRERKLLYQIFHKLESLRCITEGRVPPIKCTGEVKDFIMKVRKGPKEGEFTTENLIIKAKKDYEIMRDTLANRKSRLMESPDYRLISNWLMAVRGF